MSLPSTSAVSLSSSFSRLAGATSRSLVTGPEQVQKRSLGGKRPPSAEERSQNAPIICFCHLGWDWVWQRPQQFLSRLAKRHPVLFVEAHCTETAVAYTKTRAAAGHPNITILETHLPASRWGDGAFIDMERRRVVRAALADLDGDFDDAILWFYDPMAVTAYAGHLGESAVVYDCMDELSQFKGAPPALLQRERELVARADVVFCGGRKMREKRLPLNRNTHFYGTGVDCDHFGTARSGDLDVAPELASLRGPVLGYFGVVDERIDYELLAKLADARPDWHVVMVGPTTKVDPAEFPQRPNLHWLGGKPYAQLPALTKGFAVCLMPFAINAATEYINPTKALEYMAAGRPIVSTALDEVRTNFGGVARIGASHAEFIDLCKKEADAPSRSRVERGIRLAADNTWEAIAGRMEAHIADVFHQRESAKPVTRTTLFPVAGTQAAYV